MLRMLVELCVVGCVVAVPLALLLPRRSVRTRVTTTLSGRDVMLAAYEELGRDTHLDWSSKEQSPGLIRAEGRRRTGASVTPVPVGPAPFSGSPNDPAVASAVEGHRFAALLFPVTPVFVFYLVRAQRPQRLSLRVLSGERQGPAEVEFTAQGSRAATVAGTILQRLRLAA